MEKHGVSLVAIKLKPTSDATELTFVHERFFNQQARDNPARGRTATFAKLDAFLQLTT